MAFRETDEIGSGLCGFRILGLDLNPGTLSGEICNTIQRILKRFCTVNEELDVELYEHIRDRVELLDADAASDEQRSLRLLTASRSTLTWLTCTASTYRARIRSRISWRRRRILGNLEAATGAAV